MGHQGHEEADDGADDDDAERLPPGDAHGEERCGGRADERVDGVPDGIGVSHLVDHAFDGEHGQCAGQDDRSLEPC